MSNRFELCRALNDFEYIWGPVQISDLHVHPFQKTNCDAIQNKPYQYTLIETFA